MNFVHESTRVHKYSQFALETLILKWDEGGDILHISETTSMGDGIQMDEHMPT